MSKISNIYFHKQLRVQEAPAYGSHTESFLFLVPSVPSYLSFSMFGQNVIPDTPERRCSGFVPLTFALTASVELRTKTLSFLQKGGVPAAPSGTATLLRLSPNHQFHPRPPLAVADFRCPRLSWLDGRCVQGPGTYSPRHG